MTIEPPVTTSNYKTAMVTINDYQVPVWKILGEGWRKIKGAWGPLLGCALLLFLIPIVFIDIPKQFVPYTLWRLFSIYTLLFYFCLVALQFRMLMLGVQWVEGREIHIRMLFEYLKPRHLKHVGLLIICFLVRVFLPIALLFFLLGMVSAEFRETIWRMENTIILSLGLIVFILGISYWALRYMMALPLVFQRKISAWTAMTMAARGFDRHWFKLMLLFSTQYFASVLVGILGALITTVIMFQIDTSVAANAFMMNLLVSPKAFSQFSAIFFYIFSFCMTLLMPWLLTVYGIIYREMFADKKDESKKEVEHVGS
jgi:hypothetical protein